MTTADTEFQWFYFLFSKFAFILISLSLTYTHTIKKIFFKFSVVQCPNGYNSQSRARQEPRAENLLWGLPKDGRDPDTGAVCISRVSSGSEGSETAHP